MPFFVHPDKASRNRLPSRRRIQCMACPGVVSNRGVCQREQVCLGLVSDRVDTSIRNQVSANADNVSCNEREDELATDQQEFSTSVPRLFFSCISDDNAHERILRESLVRKRNGAQVTGCTAQRKSTSGHVFLIAGGAVSWK